MTNVQELLEVLKGLEESPEVKEKDYLTDGCSDELPELVHRAVEIADSVLITGGKVNRENKRILESHGYDVYPGERDSFGWLTGCIDTKKGTIVFG